MQHLRALVERIAPHVYRHEAIDVPPLSEAERQAHERRGQLADAWGARIKEKVDVFESEMVEGIDDLRREVDLVSGEAFETVPDAERPPGA